MLCANHAFKMLRLLPWLGALLFCTLPCAVKAAAPARAAACIQKEPVTWLSSRAELKAALENGMSSARTPLLFHLKGSLRGQWRMLCEDNMWGEYARMCSVLYRAETGMVELSFDYRDYVRLRAACRDENFRQSLTTAEQKLLARLESQTKALLEPGMCVFEQLLVLHDYLVQLARYDAEGGGHVADLLDTGRGSCEAYSATLCILLELAGIPARLVTGEAGGGPHAWNMVQLEGTWYHVDATWDDPVLGDSGQQATSHACFCLSDAEISRTHRWNREDYPACRGTDCYYYRRLGRYFTTFDAYWQAAMEAWRQGAFSFEGYLCQYGSPAQFQAALQAVSHHHTPSRLSWIGPDSAAGAVILSFGS